MKDYSYPTREQPTYDPTPAASDILQELRGEGWVTPGKAEDIHRGYEAALADAKDDIDRLKKELDYFRDMKAQTDPWDFILQWLVGKRISDLEYQLQREIEGISQRGGESRQAEGEAELANWAANAAAYQQEMIESGRAPASWYTGRGGTTDPYGTRVDLEGMWVPLENLRPESDYEPDEPLFGGAGGILPTLPDWMREYLAGPYAAREAKDATGGTAHGAGDLQALFDIHPLGAQERLDVGKQKSLASLYGWGKAGMPQDVFQYASASEKYPGWWEEYMRRAEELFPSRVSPYRRAWRY